MYLEPSNSTTGALDAGRDAGRYHAQRAGSSGRRHVYKLRITPYRTLENKIDGVVVALLDITDVVGRAAEKDGQVDGHADGKARRVDGHAGGKAGESMA